MPDDAVLAEAPDSAVLRVERRLQMLERMAELEMELAEVLQRQAIAAANPAPPAPPAEAVAAAASATGALDDLSAAFARVARSLRLTLALQARAEEQLRALLSGEAAKVEARRVAARHRAAAEAEARSKDHRDTVERLVIEAAEREIEDVETLNGVVEALEERLDEDEAYWDLDRVPLREAVERLCADLELTPDWSQWEGEGWPPRPPFSRSKFSIWSSPSRRPLLPIDKATPSPRRLE